MLFFAGTCNPSTVQGYLAHQKPSTPRTLQGYHVYKETYIKKTDWI